eukprot:3124707-Rhodomonas_salina.1
MRRRYASGLLPEIKDEKPPLQYKVYQIHSLKPLISRLCAMRALGLTRGVCATRRRSRLSLRSWH